MSTAAERLPALTSEAVRLGLSLDAAAFDRFEAYLRLLQEWEGRAGLTAIDDPGEIQRRHFAESLALLVSLRSAGLLPHEHAISIADVGTGAGFPGLPMRIAAANLRLTLIEAQERRCRFLEAAIAALDLPDVTVVQARAEEAGRAPALRGAFDLVVARALAPLPVLIEYALPLLRPGGVLATPKGSRASSERDEAGAALAALGGTMEQPLDLPIPAELPRQEVILVRRTGALDERYPRRAGIPTKRPLR